MDPSTLASLKTAAVLLVKTVECPICLEVLADPLCTNCHHRFCRVCIEKALHGKYKIPCPLCKAVVTKRSLQKIDHIGQIVEKVKQLSNAIREDTGLNVTPPRQLHATTTSSPEGHLFEEFGRAHPSPVKCYGRTRSAATAGASRRNKRAVSVNSDSETISNTTKRSRSTSDARSWRVDEIPGIKRLVANKAPRELSRAASHQPEHRSPQVQASSSMLPAQGRSNQASAVAEKPCLITVSDTSSASSCSPFHLQVRQPSETQAGTAAQMDCDVGDRSSAIGAVSQSEKVANWLQTCETVVPVISTNPEDAALDATEDVAVQGTRKSMPNRFFTTSKPVRKLNSPAGRKKLLDVSDSDPYKFVPSQKALIAAAQKGKRGRRRVTCRGRKSAPARKMKSKSPLREFENLRDYCTEEAAGKDRDAQELEIELFVTPGDMLQGTEGQAPKAPQPRKRTSKDTSRQSKRMKRSIQLQEWEVQTRELQQKINEAESFELTVLKETGPGLPNKPIAATALKDVSNLRVPPEKSRAQEYPMSPKRPGRTELGLAAQKSSPDVTSLHQTLNERTLELQAGSCTDSLRPEKANSLSLNRKQNLLHIKGSSKASILATEPKQLPSSENISKLHEETTDAVSCKPVVHDGQTCGSHIEGQDLEDNHPEENVETPAMSLKDLEGLFKKSSRKTFDISADTQDLESLSSGAINTLDLMSNICNELEEVPIAHRSPAAATAKDPSSVPQKEALTDKQDMPQPTVSLSTPVKTVVQGGTTATSKNCTVLQDAAEMPSSFALASTASYEDARKQTGSNASEPEVERCVSCPNCCMDIVVSWVNGIAKVTLKGTSLKPVLVDVGMCTERPGTARVIICKEAVTQTDIVDVQQSCSEAASIEESHPNASIAAALPASCMKEPPTIEKEDHVSDVSNHASGEEPVPLSAVPPELHPTGDSSDKPVEGESSVDTSREHLEMMQTSPLKVLGRNEAEVENVQAEIAEVASVSKPGKDMLVLSSKQNNESSEVLCEETEEQYQVSEKQSVDRGFQCQLQTIVEDSEQMDASPFSENRSPNEVGGPALGPLVGRAEELECGSGDCTQSGLQSSVQAVLPRGKDKLPTERAQECLAEQLESMAFSRVENEVLSVNKAQPEVRETGPAPFNRLRDETPSSRLVDVGCSDETYLPSYDHFLASPEVKADMLPVGATSSSQRRGSTEHAGTASIDFDFEEQGNMKPGHLTALRGSVQLVPPEGREPSSCRQEEDQSVTMLASPAEVPQHPAGYEDDKGRSKTPPLQAELSPWDSPAHSEKAATGSDKEIDNQLDGNSEESRGDEPNFRACPVSPEKQPVGSEGVTREKQKSASIFKVSGKSEKVAVTVEDSDSDGSVMLDPMTESEASDLLQRAFAMEEDSPDEVALNFARRAVAPLRKSARKRLSPELQLMAERCTPPDQSAAALLKSAAIHESEREEADNTENTEGPSTVTVSSTLSGALDRTLKEQLLEQDIQEMKKQMLMLECELQRTTAKDNCGRSMPLPLPCTAAKADNWDNCFSDSDDEMADVVPPTPPRK
ncbi:unnamed protein product, partial [Ixodes hexagonus]